MKAVFVSLMHQKKKTTTKGTRRSVCHLKRGHDYELFEIWRKQKQKFKSV